MLSRETVLIAFIGIGALSVAALSIASHVSLNSGPGHMQLAKIWFNDEHSNLSSHNPLYIHLWTRNTGGAPLQEVYVYYEARLVALNGEPIKELPKIHDQMHANALKHLEQMLDQGEHGVAVGEGDGLWDSLPMTLTPDDIENIKLGTSKIFIYAWARWRDSQNDLDHCEWLQGPSGGDISTDKLIWHICNQI